MAAAGYAPPGCHLRLRPAAAARVLVVQSCGPRLWHDQPRTGRLAAKVFVVTGGGTGIGRAVAGRVVAEGVPWSSLAGGAR
jgi:hypothetical protein